MSENKPKLRVDWASHKAAKYACEHWHYSGTIPRAKLVKVGVWENGIFIGVIIFSYGATEKLLSPYGLQMTDGCELTRIAMREHKTPISKMVSIALKKLKQSNPGMRLIVSFADPGEGHLGKIYQAGNWVYTGKSSGSYFYIDKNGKMWHPRNIGPDTTKTAIMRRPQDCKKVWKEGKHRYLMPLDKEMRKQVQLLSKPYPRPVGVIGNTSDVQSEDASSNLSAGLYPTKNASE